MFVPETKMKTPPPGCRRERAVNRRVQGDLGELSAMEWLASKGALVWIPLGHSPDVDLMAEHGESLLRIQVKTTTMRRSGSDGRDRWDVAIATSGGNRSWSGTTKRFDPATVDLLFVLVGDGRRWLLPAGFVEGERTLRLGGSKYSEFEIERGTPLEALVYGRDDSNKIAAIDLGECQSGQMDSTVNRAATPTEVRILSPPSSRRQIMLRAKRQMTIPKQTTAEAGLNSGDRLRVAADGPGRIVLERI
jgi:hypothetical protein